MPATAQELEKHVLNMGQRPRQNERKCTLLWERKFAQLVDLLLPRMSHLIRSYGLADMREDAEQACAIGVLRALESYDPAKARFATHVTWLLRGELQSLRHRVRLDQRQSARSAGVRTVSIEALVRRTIDEPGTFEIVDERALANVERDASDCMTNKALSSLLDRLEAPDHERVIVSDRIFGDRFSYVNDRKTREQHRQIVRRTFRNCAKLLAA